MARQDEMMKPALTVYQEIKRRIVDVEFTPGEKLSEARLSAELGMKRSPIRTALSRLHNEGWISISPQSGTFVKALTNRELEQMTELRVLLEAHTAAVATRRMTNAGLARLKKSFETLAPLIEVDDVEAFIQLDEELHGTIYAAADNQMVAKILMDLRDKVQWVRRACSVSFERMLDGFHELEAILDALLARDPDAAAAAMGKHIENAAAFCLSVDMAEVQKSLAARKRQREKELAAARPTDLEKSRKEGA